MDKVTSSVNIVLVIDKWPDDLVLVHRTRQPWSMRIPSNGSQEAQVLETPIATSVNTGWRTKGSHCFFFRKSFSSRTPSMLAAFLHVMHYSRDGATHPWFLYCSLQLAQKIVPRLPFFSGEKNGLPFFTCSLSCTSVDLRLAYRDKFFSPKFLSLELKEGSFLLSTAWAADLNTSLMLNRVFAQHSR